jgi:Protein of unknown function (DUF3102)
MGTEIEADAFLAETASAIRKLAKNVVRDVVQIGGLLIEAKARCGHGNWLPWLKREFDWSERTARRFTGVYEMAKTANVSDLESLEISALYQLAAPSTPESVRDDVFARVRAGEALTLSDVRHAVRPLRISYAKITAETGPTIVYDHVRLHASEPAVAERTLTADDFQNALLERHMRDIQRIENECDRFPSLKDALANARRTAAALLTLAPPEKGSGIRIVK